MDNSYDNGTCVACVWFDLFDQVCCLDGEFRPADETCELYTFVSREQDDRFEVGDD